MFVLNQISGETFPALSTNTSREARADISANGVWGGRFEKTFLDVRVFNPYATSYSSTSITNCCRNQEKEKKRQYDCHIREIEHATFTPLVFSVTGGECSMFYKRLATIISEKNEEAYSVTLSWIRCSLSFSLLRSSIHWYTLFPSLPSLVAN